MINTNFKEELINAKNEIEDIKSSLAMEILKDYKKANKRKFITNIILILCLMVAIGYILYLHNDIQTVTTTDTIDIQDVNDINDSDIGIGR